mmetsp:Transcript_4194/g.6412  ORF Transcript_4194/g.6412 Transcript_4194/m.6412 type:complete len:1160 (-) Transcript_4194:553-4032(-)
MSMGDEVPHASRGSQGDSIILEEEIDPSYVPSNEEVTEYAKWLGMDPNEDSELFWIAREGLKAPLPESWKPCKTKDTEEIYYFNFSTGASTWDHPCDEYYRRLYEEEKYKLDRTNKTHLRPSSASAINNREEVYQVLSPTASMGSSSTNSAIISGVGILASPSPGSIPGTTATVNNNGILGKTTGERSSENRIISNSSQGQSSTLPRTLAKNVPATEKMRSLISQTTTNLSKRNKPMIDRSSLEQEPSYARRTLSPVNEESSGVNSPRPAQFQALEASREAAVRDRDALQMHVSRLQSELHSSRAEVKALRTTTSSLAANSDEESNNYKAELDRLQSNLSDMQHARNDAINELASVRHSAGIDRERCTALERDLLRLRQERDRNLKDEAVLLAALRDRANHADSETKRVQEQYEQKLQALQVLQKEQADTHQDQVKTLERKAETAEARLATQKQEHAATISKLQDTIKRQVEDRAAEKEAQFQAQIKKVENELQTQIKKAENELQSSRKAQENEIRATRHEAKVATDDANIKEKRCQQLEAALAAAESRWHLSLTQFSNEDESSTKSCTQCLEKQNEIEKLSITLLEKEKDEDKKFEARQARLEAEVREARMAAEGAMRKCTSFEARCEEAESKLQIMTKEKNASEARAIAAETRVTKLINAQRDNLTSDDEARKQLVETIEKATENEKEAHRLLSAAEDRLAVADAERNRLRSELESLAQRCQHAELRADEAESAQADLKRQVNQLQARLEAQQSQSSRLLSEALATEKLRYETVVAESERLKARCEREMQRAQEQRDAARRQVDELGDRLVAATSTNQNDNHEPQEQYQRNEHRSSSHGDGEREEQEILNGAETVLEGSEDNGIDSSTWRTNRLELEHEALDKAKRLVKRQRDWLRRRQRKLLLQREAWRRSHRSEHTKQKLDAETNDINRLIRQLRTIQSWLSARDAKLRSVIQDHDHHAYKEGLPVPEVESDDAFDHLSTELDDDARSLMTILGSTDDDSPIPHEREKMNNSGPAYFVLQPDGPPVPVYYQQPTRFPAQVQANYVDFNDQFSRLQGALRATVAQAKQNTTAPSVPNGIHKSGIQLEAWDKARTSASRAVEIHVQWLARLKAELTAHCYANAAAAGSGNNAMWGAPYMAPPIIPPPPEFRPPAEVK